MHSSGEADPGRLGDVAAAELLPTIWQFNYVVVPRDYKANTLRSEKDCLKNGYEIKCSTVFEN